MNKLFAILATISAIACGSPTSDVEIVGSQQQAVTNFGYPIGALQVSHNLPASAFVTPTNYPSRGFGGVQTQISRISNGTVNAPVFYASQGLSHIPTVSCTGDIGHDGKAILTAACHEYLGRTHKQWTGIAHIWIQYPIGGNDINECPSISSGAVTGKIDGTEGCSGMAINGGWTVGLPADGAADLSPQPPDNVDWGHYLTHEILHAAPANMISTGGVISGLNTFARSHDGTVACPAGQVVSSFNFANCVVDESAGGGVFLATFYNDLWSPHARFQNEPWDYKVDAGWVTSANVRVLPTPSVSTGLGLAAVEAQPVSGGNREIYIQRPSFNGIARALILEFRNQMWIGGCDPNGVAPDPPCTTVNAPGVYVWLKDNAVANPPPTIRGHYYEVAWSSSPSDTTYHHIRPLPVGTAITIEPGVTITVTGQTATTAAISVTAQ